MDDLDAALARAKALEEALKNVNELEMKLAKRSSSVIHRFTKTMLGSMAGFGMEMLVESAYDYILYSRKNKKIVD